jgi:hypothetical protein
MGFKEEMTHQTELCQWHVEGTQNLLIKSQLLLASRLPDLTF